MQLTKPNASSGAEGVWCVRGIVALCVPIENEKSIVCSLCGYCCLFSWLLDPLTHCLLELSELLLHDSCAIASSGDPNIP